MVKITYWIDRVKIEVTEVDKHNSIKFEKVMETIDVCAEYIIYAICVLELIYFLVRIFIFKNI